VLVAETAPAKVNLYLHVVGRRADGYHLLDSLAVFPGAADMLRAKPADGLTLEVEGPFGAGLGAGPDNLVLRAAAALAAAGGTGDGARLVLEKNLPVASGIGGGSTDAAAALRALVRLWGTRLSPERLQDIARGLGADVPVCLARRPARMQGVGEILGAAPALPACGMVLLNPGVAVATPDVFRARTGDFSKAPLLPAAWPDAGSMATDLDRLQNDLEAPAMALVPEIGVVLEWLRGQRGCLLARMSGSGATCFGLFATADAAAAVAAQAPASWWAWGGAMSGRARGFTEGSRTPY
jgi:4-diphosphocytidyl-2-C-methyl-D-erythritol kinase